MAENSKNLEERVLGKFDKATNHVLGVQSEDYVASLDTHLLKAVTAFAGKDMKENAAGLAGEMWKIATGEIAEKYGLSNDNAFQTTDPDTKQTTDQYESFMEMQLGISKKDIEDLLSEVGKVDSQTAGKIVGAAYGKHLAIRRSRVIAESIRSNEDVQNLLGYLAKLQKQDNTPESIKRMKLPEFMKSGISIQDAQKLYGDVVQKLLEVSDYKSNTSGQKEYALPKAA